MKLFYSKGACSLAPHIVLAELNMVYEIEAVDLRSKSCPSGDFWKINAKGSVPALRMESGDILTEGQVISRYLADMKPEIGLIPRPGTLERYRCEEWLSYISSELHKNFSPLFMPNVFVQNEDGMSELKASMHGILKKKVAYVSEQLADNDYLMGKQFSVADAYLFTVLSWSNYVKFDLSTWSNLSAYMKRVSARPGVVRAMKEEGML
jgi:glutathione S-transferase